MNEYYVCLWQAPGRAEPPVAWDPFSEETRRDFAGVYWGRVFQEFERRFPDAGLTIYLTWDLFELPSYGDDVIAVVIGDEWGLTPQYAPRVRRTFKLHGARPTLERPLSERSRLATLTLLRYGRSRAKRLRSDVRDVGLAWAHRPAATRTEVLRLPVGYNNLLDLPTTPLDERSIDVNFAGSVENKGYSRRDPAYWVSTPKAVARSAMVDGVRRWGDRRPGSTVHLKITESYTASIADSPSSYSTQLMESKVCLAPRGTTVETYRVFEGLRYGCVVISDPLPSAWYLDGAPVVQIRDWSTLPEVLEELFADPARLERLHRSALAFWDERCSERVVGSFVATAIS